MIGYGHDRGSPIVGKNKKNIQDNSKITEGEQSMKKSVLRSYARLVARKGVNIQKGQEVVVSAELDQPEFVQMVVEECYKAGASKVKVEWSYQPLTVVDTRYRTVKSLGTLNEYEEARWKYLAEKKPCIIHIESEDPDGLKKMNMKKHSAAVRMRYPVVKPYRDEMENKYQWCIVAVPGPIWAKKLFPELSRKQAMEKLWEKILLCARVDDDPEAAWAAHNKDLRERCDYLNSLGLKSLKYKSSNGTDFEVGLIDGSKFLGGSDKTLSGIEYNPNIPSEECFISPMKGVAEGIVYATKPLCYRGVLIDKFWIRFKDGKAVEWKAETNNEALTEMINMDEGSACLGECALVPFNSPINNSGIMFMNTLFDENAVCHLALGKGFNDTLVGYENMSNDECKAKGINESMIHEDFMIGSEDLEIVGTTKDGRKVQIFKNGNWAF